MTINPLAPPNNRAEYLIYCRHSSDRQQKTSNEDQIGVCRKYGDRFDMHCPDANIFADSAVTGQTDDRPQLERLKALVRSGRLKARDLVIYDTGRLARDIPDAGQLRKFFKFYRIRVHFVQDGLTSDAKGFDMTHTMKAMMDQQYSTGIADSVLRGQRGRVERGLLPSGNCFGYRHERIEDPNKPGLHGHAFVLGMRATIDPVKASIVYRIFEDYANGLGGYQVITRKLNEDNIPPPRRPHKGGKPGWNHAAVRYILRNERYIGIVKFGRTETVMQPEPGPDGKKKKIHRKADDPEVTVHVDETLRIIPQPLWDAVQERMKTNRDRSGREEDGSFPSTGIALCNLAGHADSGGFGRTAAARRYTLSGLLHCGVCLGRMIMFGGPKGHYYCGERQRRMGCKNQIRLNRESAELQLMTKLSELISSSISIASLRSAVVARVMVESTAQLARRSEATLQREALIDERKEASTAIANLVLALSKNPTSEPLHDALRGHEARLRVAKEKLAEIEIPINEVTEAEVNAFLKAALTNLAEVLMADPIVCRRELNKRIKKLILHPIVDGTEVKYKVEGFFTVFFGDEPLLLGSSVQSSSKQQQPIGFSLDELLIHCGEQSNKAQIIPFPETTQGKEDLAA